MGGTLEYIATISSTVNWCPGSVDIKDTCCERRHKWHFLVLKFFEAIVSAQTTLQKICWHKVPVNSLCKKNLALKIYNLLETEKRAKPVWAFTFFTKRGSLTCVAEEADTLTSTTLFKYTFCKNKLILKLLFFMGKYHIYLHITSLLVSLPIENRRIMVGTRTLYMISKQYFYFFWSSLDSFFSRIR